jgi:hypothetical protein
MWERRAAYFFHVPEFHTYQGEEVKVKWLNEGQMALTTDNPEFPFRVIERKHIREIDGRPYEFREKTAKDTVRLVQGSKGKTYEVTGNYRCTCPGFTFRGRCRHLEENVT